MSRPFHQFAQRTTGFAHSNLLCTPAARLHDGFATRMDPWPIAFFCCWSLAPVPGLVYVYNYMKCVRRVIFISVDPACPAKLAAPKGIVQSASETAITQSREHTNDLILQPMGILRRAFAVKGYATRTALFWGMSEIDDDGVR